MFNLIVSDDENIRIVEQGQVLQILRTDSDHAGKWSCVAENDAGVKELEMVLDVFSECSSRIEFEIDTNLLMTNLNCSKIDES